MNDWNPFEGVDFYKGLAKKTLYQLDLEVKDRKPDIVPKVGDKVKIKSREWYEKWKGPEWWISFSSTECCFGKDMAKLCGKTFTVTSVIDTEAGERWRLGFQSYCFVPEMFEEVYPQESSKEEKCTKGLYSSSISASALETLLTGTSAFPAINSVQGIGISSDLGTLSRQGVGIETCPIPSPRITFPINGFGSTSAVVRQDLFKNKEPELQTIKKHCFIKLENL